MTKFDSTVAATDFSDDADHAAERAARICAATGARGTLLHVVEFPWLESLKRLIKPPTGMDASLDVCCEAQDERVLRVGLTCCEAQDERCYLLGCRLTKDQGPRCSTYNSDGFTVGRMDDKLMPCVRHVRPA